MRTYLVFQHIALMPHAVCWREDPALIWTMVVTNALTFFAYLTICLTLLFIARRTRRVIARDWAYFVIGFALFIVACGATHLMDVVTTWVPFFWVDAATNVITAALSVWVALQLIRRAGVVGHSVNDYAAKLASAEGENVRMQHSLLAAQQLEEWSRMSAVLAHEIANPLETIENLLYLLRTTPGMSDETIGYAQKASDEAARVLTLSRSILSFFRKGSIAEPMDLRIAADSVRFLLTQLFPTRHIPVSIAATGNTVIEALPGEARQVLLNLVRNAVEASPSLTDKAAVHVDLQGQAAGVTIVVADQGVGIAPELLPDVFNFGVSTKGENGNGLGLWSVRQIMLNHGGSIDVASTPGQGTTFTLFWPRTFQTQQAA